MQFFFGQPKRLLMKVRFHFRRSGKGNAVPVYHQDLLAGLIRQWINSAFTEPQDKQFDLYTFSSLKGLNKVEGNLMFYHSQQVHIMLSSPHESWLTRLADYIMSQGPFQIHEMSLIPESYEAALPPVFGWESRFVSMSPMILFDPALRPDAPSDILNPYANDFSDLLYDTLLDKMESYPLGNYNLEEYSKFQVVPDSEYIRKLKETRKKFGRPLEVGSRKVKAYLFPFTLFAHPDVQRFVYAAGIGCMGAEGFGCVDLIVPGAKKI
jgi:CRISPR-associated endoribonuclease Cas6